MRIINTKNKNFKSQIKSLIFNRQIESKKSEKVVSQILSRIRKKGDEALIYYSNRFDKAKLNKKKIKVSESEIKKNILKLDSSVKKSIDLAFTRISAYHKKQKNLGFQFKDKLGNKLGYKITPLKKIGIYVPGGTASYPSTLLMNCIPALEAGVKEIYCVMPAPKGELNPAALYAAKKCKVKAIFRVGGAQAIGALAYGTKSIPQVDKIVGPGNIYVATAKKQVFGTVGIDMMAGPSEITVIADQSNKPDWTAIDLLSQAEHDVSSQSILLTTNLEFALKVKKEVNQILKYLPRKKIASQSIKKFGCTIICKNKKEITDIANLIAPEHLEIKIKNPEKIEKNIFNAGSIFLGEYSPEAIGDYLAGPNHVLPTSGTARFASGLSVSDFLKKTSIIKCSKTGIVKIGQSAIKLANYEGLEAHAMSVQKRLG